MATFNEFKAIVTFKDGTHFILRFSKRMVASFVYAFREMQRNIFKNDNVLWKYLDDEWLNLSFIESCKFIDNRTHSEYLTVA